MHLSLRYAASLPLLLAIAFALLSPLLKQLGLLPTGRGEIPIYALLIMAPVVSLLLVIPNVAAALAVNRYGDTATVFVGVFVVTGVVVWIGQGLFLNGLFQSLGGTDLLSPKAWLWLAIDFAACLAAAALIPEPAVG
jgi:hypothetical protein